jgi:hypothetical protein
MTDRPMAIPKRSEALATMTTHSPRHKSLVIAVLNFCGRKPASVIFEGPICDAIKTSARCIPPVAHSVLELPCSYPG